MVPSLPLDVSLANTAPRRARRSDMRILVCGDFSARGGEAPAPQSANVAANVAAPCPVDLETFDARLAMLAPCVAVPGEDLAEAATVLRFACLDDFHPDRLIERDPVLIELTQLKRRLRDPTTFASAAAALAPALDASDLPTTAPVAVPSSAETAADTLARLLGGASQRQPSPAETSVAAVVDDMIRRLVTPLAAPATVPSVEVTRYLDAADYAATIRLRRLLHHPPFQRLEASWRSLHELLIMIDSGEDLEIALLDVDQAQLGTLVGQVGEAPRQTPCYRLLEDFFVRAEASPAEMSLQILIGDYRFGASSRDARLLARLGAICREFGAHCFAAADPALAGCADAAHLSDPRAWGAPASETVPEWRDLRRDPAARALGLALPRLLLRLPYGQATDPCERLRFEELPAGEPDRAHLLWGNPAYGCARLVADAFAAQGGVPELTQLSGELPDLPAYLYQQDGEKRPWPCAEFLLPDAASDAIRVAGLIPVVANRRLPVVRLGPLRAFAH